MARGFVPHGAIFTSGMSGLAISLREPSKPKRGYYAVRQITGACVALESYIPNGKVSGILPDPFVGPAKGVIGEV